jgi:glycine oxidase
LHANARVFFIEEVMEVEYVLVGFGLAGLAFATVLEEQQKSFVVFEDASQTSSNVAGGVYNPVILKRFTPVWQAKSQLEVALPFYQKWEQKLGKTYDHKFDTYRIFSAIEEQNNWFLAADKPLLSPYMDSKVIWDTHPGLNSEYGFGKLHHTGRIDTQSLLSDCKTYFESQQAMRYESFDYEALDLSSGEVTYKDIKAKRVVFCEGYGMHQNPFFKHLPMQEVKGELLTIHAPLLEVDFLVKAAVFLLPLGNHYYKVGATFHWKDKSLATTEAGKKELQNKLASFMTVPYTIVEQSAGIRPTVKDRRPLLGVHPKHTQLALFNGLGTRGVMIAPKMAQELYQHLSEGTPLEEAIDLRRFSNKGGSQA